MTSSQDRLLELLTLRATEGLSAGDDAELEMLLAEQPFVDPNAYEQAATSLELAMMGMPLEPLPADLQRKLEHQALEFVQGRGASGGGAHASAALRPVAPTSSLTWLGWVAAAASLLFAFLIWRGTGDEDFTASDLRAELLAQADDLVRVTWSPGEDEWSPGVGGEVAWSPSRQQGFMTFENLHVNDPTSEQYQLWIFDSARSDLQPVDGGVFDVTEQGEVTVAIDARLPITEATLFAVTVEKPGGVVVSDRERLVLMAAPQ